MSHEPMKLSFKALAMDVLVVDDEPISRQMASQSLESVGYCVHQAGNGREALETLARQFDRIGRLWLEYAGNGRRGAFATQGCF